MRCDLRWLEVFICGNDQRPPKKGKKGSESVVTGRATRGVPRQGNFPGRSRAGPKLSENSGFTSVMQRREVCFVRETHAGTLRYYATLTNFNTALRFGGKTGRNEVLFWEEFHRLFLVYKLD